MPGTDQSTKYMIIFGPHKNAERYVLLLTPYMEFLHIGETGAQRLNVVLKFTQLSAMELGLKSRPL